MTEGFSLETMQMKRRWGSIFIELKGKNYQSRIVLSRNLSKMKIKTFKHTTSIKHSIPVDLHYKKRERKFFRQKKNMVEGHMDLHKAMKNTKNSSL